MTSRPTKCAPLAVVVLLSILGVLYVVKERETAPVRQWRFTSDPANLPTVFVVTPSNPGVLQLAHLTRMASTLVVAGNVHWIVAEDAFVQSASVAALLRRSGLRYTHLASRSALVVTDASIPRYKHPRGVDQRNEAIMFIRQHLRPLSGAVLFADDDNTYDPELFHLIAEKTKRASTWPVGLVGGLLYEGVSEGKFRVEWHKERPFPIDMCGFAVHVSELQRRDKTPLFSSDSARGMLESDFLSHIVTSKDQLEVIEPTPQRLRVLAWHTRSEPPELARETDLQQSEPHWPHYWV